ncbi:MAG: hypothetical protein RKH07_15715 [Gammaproteobacteria bacterium]
MSKKKKEKSRQQGTYALCITAGLILGLGLGPAMDNVVVTMIVGGIAGAIAAYFINQKATNKRH